MTILDFFKLASGLHAGQVDKLGRPYIEHLTRVMLRVMEMGGDREQLIAALLHDSIEDGKASSDELILAGVPMGSILIILQLTKTKSEGYLEYIARVKQFDRAIIIKRADLLDNSDPSRLNGLPTDVADRLRNKYEAALQLLNS